jgi:FlaG/FlaF family flagellin (archaellin)
MQNDVRAQSETIGVVLQIGIVVTLVTLVSVVALGQIDTSSDPLADLQTEMNATHLTVTHAGGDEFAAGDLRVVLDGESASRQFTVDAANVTGPDGKFAFGDEYARLHGLDDGPVTIRVVHVPSNTLVEEERLEVPSGTVVFAVNAGGSAYTASDGVTYQSYSGSPGGNTYSTGDSIAGTSDDTLYQTERWGEFTYTTNVKDGTYKVTLELAEIYWENDGQRIYDVSLEGDEVISNIDIHSRVGHDRALTLTRTVTVTDGTLDIGFSLDPSDVDNAKVSAIKVERVD